MRRRDRVPTASSPSPVLAAVPVLAALAALSPGGAHAGRAEVHDGFFANASVGFGHTVMTSEPLHIEGDGVLITLAAGATVAENLQIFAHLSETQIFAPRFRPNGAFSDDDADVSADIGSYGVGATWYHGPTNIYVTGSASLVSASLSEQPDENDDSVETRFRTDLGFGAALTLGKEWWVDAEWGVGAAITGQVSRIADQDQVTWHNGTFGLLFSATWN